MARRFEGLTADGVRANLAAVREEIAEACARAGRDSDGVEVLAAVKYVAGEDLAVLADAGITLVGENRAQELEAKAAAWPGAFTWDFIGALQSRRVRAIVPHVRLVHSVASESAIRELAKHRRPGLEVLLQLELAGEESKAGFPAAELDRRLEQCAEAGVEVAGLMTMPPLAERPEESRRWFATLRELAEARGLRRLSMGTTQDFAVAVEEGATIVRIGTRLYETGQENGPR